MIPSTPSPLKKMNPWETLKKYFSIYVMIFKTSFISDLEFRANYVTRIVVDIFWYAAQIITFEVLFEHTPKIGDWNVAQFRIFLGVIFTVDALYMLIIHDNIENFSDKVRKGDLDLLLVKPVNSQFLISFQRAATASLGNLLISIIWLSWSLQAMPHTQYVRLLWLVILVPCSLLVIYSFRFMMAATAVIYTRSESFQFMWYQFYRLGMRPDSMYVPWLRFALLTVIPVGVISSIPARAILEPPSWLLIWPLIVGPVLLYISNRFWNFSLKHYSSASS